MSKTYTVTYGEVVLSTGRETWKETEATNCNFAVAYNNAAYLIDWFERGQTEMVNVTPAISHPGFDLWYSKSIFDGCVLFIKVTEE